MKTVFEEAGITYSRQGDYLLPDLKLSEMEHDEIGIWGQRRRRYLREHHRVVYYSLLTSCRLYSHLSDVEKQANDLFDQLETELANQEGITEQLKAADMMAWVRKMNSIRNRAEEIVLNTVIYV